jgi:hypothetical protein
MFFAVQPGSSQFLPQLQAKTPEEFDAYLDVIEAKPQDRIRKAREFLSAYPESDMRLRVYQVMAEECRDKGDAACAREAAAAGIKLAPDYVPLLTLAASIEANTSPSPDTRAAERALALLGQIKAPRTVDPKTWLRETAKLRAENLASLGIAAFKRDDLPGAIQKLKDSVIAHPMPANQYRLAMLYIEARRPADARPLLEQVAKGGDPALRQKAVAALSSMAPR